MRVEDSSLYLGDIGTAIIVEFPVDISSATGLSFVIESPRKVRSSLSAAVHSINGEARYIRAVLVGTEFNIPGLWTVWPKMTVGSWTGRCKPVFIQVGE